MPAPTEGKTTVLLQPSQVAFSDPFFDRQTHKKRGFARSACQAAKPCLSDPTDITHPSLQPPAPCWNSTAEGTFRVTELTPFSFSPWLWLPFPGFFVHPASQTPFLARAQQFPWLWARYQSAISSLVLTVASEISLLITVTS